MFCRYYIIVEQFICSKYKVHIDNMEENMDINYIKELIEQENENEFIEFKCNRFEKDEIGKYISAISNSAAENNVDYGYIVWGVTNDTHEILGTNFNPDIELQNEPLKHYLARNLNPSIAFNFYVEEIENKKLLY